MASLNLEYSIATHTDGLAAESLALDQFQRFNTDILGLGNISQEAEYLEALVAMFDLEGFTTFCNQIDPHLVVPEYLDSFLRWLFDEIKAELTVETKDNRMLLWARLPFFAKFMGDGILFLWNTKYADNIVDIGNIVISLHNICQRYKDNFVPELRINFTRPPQRLRCGIARGQVISIGNGSDFVGSCINMAARLQKLGNLAFAFPRRGFNLTQCFPNEKRREEWIPKRVAIRGIGDEEIIMVNRTEFQSLAPEQQREFKDP